MVLGKRLQIALSEAALEDLADRDIFAARIGSILAGAERDVTWLKSKFYLLPGLSPARWLACVTSNLSVRRDEMAEVGLFDEEYVGWGWEDSDLGYRFLERGIELVKDASLVNHHIVHPGSPTKREEELQNYRHFRSKFGHRLSTRLTLNAIRAIRDTAFWLRKTATP